ncbi:ribose-5-phosphate isomerase [Nonomuraea glycinis]|uniref:Ribose-5-phosphate isomerase B n=1 Tax=Nonomuraea glycinis TaxID=2047744 RepID=A0A918A1Z1_9ACTN|nr:ribose-5-phosphate isomerase [Nonomuraea glycinis]
MALAVLTLVRADGTGNGRAQLWKTGRVRVYIGADHAGYELKNHLVSWLKEHGHEVTDCGPSVYDAEDDYPAFCLRAAEGVAGDPGSLGIVIGGSGNGEQISANKVRGIRAALAWSEETAQLAREHNNANVVSLGARMHTTEEATGFVEVFLGTAFSGSARHSRRIAQVQAYETIGQLPSLP